jgi:hypothetical protein
MESLRPGWATTLSQKAKQGWRCGSSGRASEAELKPQKCKKKKKSEASKSEILIHAKI